MDKNYLKYRIGDPIKTFSFILEDFKEKNKKKSKKKHMS